MEETTKDPQKQSVPTEETSETPSPATNGNPVKAKSKENSRKSQIKSTLIDDDSYCHRVKTPARTTNSAGSKRLECDQCDFSTRNENFLIGHKKIHEKSLKRTMEAAEKYKIYKLHGKELFQCAKCNAKISKKATLLEHLTACWIKRQKDGASGQGSKRQKKGKGKATCPDSDKSSKRNTSDQNSPGGPSNRQSVDILYKCTSCEFASSKYELWSDHLLSFHSKDSSVATHKLLAADFNLCIGEKTDSDTESSTSHPTNDSQPISTPIATTTSSNDQLASRAVGTTSATGAMSHTSTEEQSTIKTEILGLDPEDVPPGINPRCPVKEESIGEIDTTMTVAELRSFAKPDEDPLDLRSFAKPDEDPLDLRSLAKPDEDPLDLIKPYLKPPSTPLTDTSVCDLTSEDFRASLKWIKREKWVAVEVSACLNDVKTEADAGIRIKVEPPDQDDLEVPCEVVGLRFQVKDERVGCKTEKI